MKKIIFTILTLLCLIFSNKIVSQTFPDSLFIQIPGDTFSMGEDETEYEGPPGTYDATVHTVTLSDFWMSATEITNQQYVDFLNSAFTDGLVEVKVETAVGPDLGQTLVFGTANSPDDYKENALINLDGTRVMKDHDNADLDTNEFTGVIEPENPLNVCYVGYDDSRNEGDKFYVKRSRNGF